MTTTMGTILQIERFLKPRFLRTPYEGDGFYPAFRPVVLNNEVTGDKFIAEFDPNDDIFLHKAGDSVVCKVRFSVGETSDGRLYQRVTGESTFSFEEERALYLDDSEEGGAR